jgi:hypothetical protein
MQIASPSRRSPARTHLCTAWERSHSAKKVIIPDPGLCVCVCFFSSFSPSRSVSARAALVVLLLYLFGIKATGWSENKSCPAPQRQPLLGIWPL